MECSTECSVEWSMERLPGQATALLLPHHPSRACVCASSVFWTRSIRSRRLDKQVRPQVSRHVWGHVCSHMHRHVCYVGICADMSVVRAYLSFISSFEAPFYFDKISDC